MLLLFNFNLSNAFGNAFVTPCREFDLAPNVLLMLEPLLLFIEIGVVGECGTNIGAVLPIDVDSARTCEIFGDSFPSSEVVREGFNR